MTRRRRRLGFEREPQLAAEFTPGDVHAGYYMDLRPLAMAMGTPAEAELALGRMTSNRRLANPVTVSQLGLGAWQLESHDPHWANVVRGAVSWLAEAADDHGRIPYLFPMVHTYRLDPPWCSAMAQGEAISLLIRAERSLADPSLRHIAAQLAKPLIDPGFGLIVPTAEGPVLAEYPTAPPAHVLNGWIFGLWGLYDLHAEAPADPALGERIREATDSGFDTLAKRLPLYETHGHWSRYDLYPHPIIHVASPFYHRLHIEQLRATARLSSRPEFARVADAWERAAATTRVKAIAVSRKVAFRLVRPRSGRRSLAGTK